MPRQARLDAPGALHHIIVRGINKAPIFKDDQDKSRFLERLGENVLQGHCAVHAWVLMTNHIHLLFKSGKDGISAVMRKQLTWYAQYFNRRHGNFWDVVSIYAFLLTNTPRFNKIPSCQDRLALMHPEHCITSSSGG